MIRLSILLLVFVMTFQLDLLALAVGKVTKLKPPVTILPPHQKEAHELKEGEEVLEGSSIVTQGKSFAIISFYNGHKLIVSPKSKIYVEQMEQDRPGVVQLLVGQVRSNVRPAQDKEREEKKGSVKEKENFYLRTRNAAMGVRGTQFQALYNAENNMTSLLTLSGKVALSNIDEKSSSPVEREKLIEKLQDHFAKEKVVEAKVGDYVRAGEESVSEPVKISPVQLTLIKINEEPQLEKKFEKGELDREVEKVKEEYKETDSSLPSKETTLRAGGLVDLKSGFYIPPSQDSEYDAKSKIYIPKEDIGKLEKDGSYTPPEGLKIDPTQGFVVAEKQEGKKVEELAKKLNIDIQTQIQVIKKKSTLEENWDSPYNKYYNR